MTIFLSLMDISFTILMNSSYKIIYYDRIDFNGRIDVAKSNSSKECVVCHYW